MENGDEVNFRIISIASRFRIGVKRRKACHGTMVLAYVMWLIRMKSNKVGNRIENMKNLKSTQKACNWGQYRNDSCVCRLVAFRRSVHVLLLYYFRE